MPIIQKATSSRVRPRKVCVRKKENFNIKKKKKNRHMGRVP